MVRHVDEGGSFNRGVINGNPLNDDGPNTPDRCRNMYGCNCIADKCAMWRWGTYIAPPLDAEPGKLVAGINHLATWGYCGLAGKPELAL